MAAAPIGDKNRECDVQATSGRLGSWTDCLAQKYSSVAEDTSAGAKKREAAALMSVAEGHVGKEEAAPALKAAQDALAAFKDASDAAGTADAVRLVAHVLCCTGKPGEGEALAKEQLFKFREAADKSGEAKMLLSLAEAHCASGTADAVEQASQEASEAVRLLRGEGDKTMLAAAQLVLASVCLEKKGDTKKKADEAKQACDEALPIFRDLGEAKAEAYALHVMACARAVSGANEGALRAAKEAQALFVKAELRKQAAFELYHIAGWHLKEGDVDDAVAAALESLDIFEDDLHATEAEASVVQVLVKAHLERKEAKEALKLAKYELDRFQESGNPKGEAAAQELVMLAYFSMGNVDRAQRFAQRAADTLEDMGDRKSQAKVLRTMCTLHRTKGDHETALRAAQEALNIFEDLEDTKEQAITLQSRADVYLEKKEHSRALSLAAEARELYSDAKHVEGEVSALLQLAAAQFAEGDLKKAAASAREAQDKATEVQDQQGEAAALRTLVEVHVMEREFDSALRVLGSLLTLVKEMGDREEEVTTMVLTSRALIMQIMQKEEEGKSNEKMYKATADKATKLAKDALATARKLESAQVLGTALFTVGQTQMMNGKMGEATKAADEALTVFRDCSYLQGEAATLTLLAGISLYNRDIAKARELGEEAVYIYQQVGDADGEDQAWTELERVEKVEEEIKQRYLQEEQMKQQWQMQQWAMQQGQMPMMPQEGMPQEAEQSAAAGGYEAKIMKIDLGAGLDPAVLKGQILEVAKGLIGYDEDIEFDAPLMESGLTSNTAVLLRDALTQTLPGVNLPVTLVFDYPSISNMTELIVENAEKAARKAKKKLQG
mmetsp:Transcript_51107/g.163593  ORF Transcript_51107/g.163593 Transcript_51107/m.163593 type:complete len:841 (-) Transcript_51107:371-2893(-)